MSDASGRTFQKWVTCAERQDWLSPHFFTEHKRTVWLEKRLMRVAKTKTGPTAQAHKIEHSLGKKFNSSPESSRTHWLQVFSLCLGYVTVLVRRALALINRAQAPVTPSSLVSFLSSTRCDYCLRTSQRVGLWSLWPSLFFFILKRVHVQSALHT